jgi:hypothetical protein
MKLELIRDKSRDFPKVENPLEYSEIRIWHCGYRSFDWIRSFQNVESIEIATYPDSTLESIGRLPTVKFLFIIHLPKITDISPLANLQSLEKLELQTLPSSAKTQQIKSLYPLEKLPNLRSFNFGGFTVEDGSLQPLHSCPNLEVFHSGNLFSIREFVSLKAAKPGLEGGFLNPLVKIPLIKCSKCGSEKVMLSGVRKNAIHCPKCHESRVQKHLAEWSFYETQMAK